MFNVPVRFRAPRAVLISAGSVCAVAALGLGLLVTANSTATSTVSTSPLALTAERSPGLGTGPTAGATTGTDSAVTPVAVVKVKAPKPASKTKKAKNVPERPRDKHTGKRIVYDKALMTVWLMDANNQVVARYPVVGRWDRPAKGTYHIFSKSKKAFNPNSKVTFNNMVRFTYGPDTHSAIGFHAIPRYYDGTMMHSTKQLGLAIARGGCVRLSEKASRAVYKFLKVGDLVVVLPSP
jgi:hypothetical protein